MSEIYLFYEDSCSLTNKLESADLGIRRYFPEKTKASGDDMVICILGDKENSSISYESEIIRLEVSGVYMIPVLSDGLSYTGVGSNAVRSTLGLIWSRVHTRNKKEIEQMLDNSQSDLIRELSNGRNRVFQKNYVEGNTQKKYLLTRTYDSSFVKWTVIATIAFSFCLMVNLTSFSDEICAYVNRVASGGQIISTNNGIPLAIILLVVMSAFMYGVFGWPSILMKKHCISAKWEFYRTPLIWYADTLFVVQIIAAVFFSLATVD